MSGGGITRVRIPMVAALLCAVMLAACSAHHTGLAATPTATAAGPSDLAGNLQIAADASLDPVIGQLAAGFLSKNPGVHLLPISYEGTQALTTSILDGATPDVIAVSDPAAVTRLGATSLVVSATVHAFASDPLQIVVKAGNPTGIAALGDLAKAGTGVVLPDPSIPLGAEVIQLLAEAGVRITPMTTELQVPAIVQDIVTGTANAGIVAASDVVTGGSAVTGVAIPASDDVGASETVAAMTNSPNQTVAAAFAAYTASAGARTILRAAGFVPATS
jgi:molybdate transport system substrate-binding protein